MKKIFFSSLISFACCNAFAQNVGIGTITPNSSAQLDVSSNTKGMLIPRMTDAEKNAIPSPAQGLMLFNTTTNSFQYFNSAVWINVSNSSIITGTANKVARFNSPWGITNSLLTDNGTGVSINSTNAVADASALLDMTSTGKGILIPRMNTVQRTAIVTPANGLLVYDTDLAGFWFYNSSAWTSIGSGTSNWSEGGTNIYNNNTGNVGIGTSSPVSALHIKTSASQAFTIENANPLAPGLTNAMYFANDLTGASSSKYSGAIKTIGGSAFDARMGFFTFASPGQGGLVEHMSITDAGSVGIGTTTPVAKLDVAGSINATGNLDIDGNITANNGKAVLRSNSTTPQKIIRTVATFSSGGIPPNSYVVSGNLSYEAFGSAPFVCLGAASNGNGEWYQILIYPANVTTTTCQFVLYNTGPVTAAFTNVSWQVLITGAQ